MLVILLVQTPVVSASDSLLVAFSPLVLAVAIVFGYLFGSLSFAIIVAKSRGVDIRNVGSGNPGATNVKRALG